MSTSPDDRLSTRPLEDVSPSDVEATAKELMTLAEELEAGIGEDRVPPEFAERVNQLRQTAERLHGS